jgi:RNA polymerase sigma factor (sigma-70 family)
MSGFGTQRLLYEALLCDDDAAFVHLYRFVYAPIASYVWEQGGTHKQARDLVHESIVGFLFKLKTGGYEWRDEAQLTTYVISIGRNLWHEQQRRKLRTEPADEDVPDEADNEDRELDFELRCQVVEQALAELGEKCRRAIELYYWQKRPMTQIAALLGWASEAVARKQKSLCLKALRAKLPPKL